MKKRPKIHIIMVCKILIDGVMVVKLGKIVYVFTQHVHTTFEISTSFISQNIPVEMLFLFKKRSKIHIILVCKLYIYRAIDLKLGMLVYPTCTCTLSSLNRINRENILDFVILYHKNGKN